MQVVILCGGKGTRLSEYTESIPKPLIEVGNKPILWHIVQLYKSFGHKDFIFCLGYKGDKIREYFENEKDVKIDFVDTGIDANKAERLLKVKDKIDGTFLVSYGDDLSDVNLDELIKFHKEKKKLVTLTAVPLSSPFGILSIDGESLVLEFREKPKLDVVMNGGFYVMEKKIFDYIKPCYDLEKETFENLAKQGQIAAFRHRGFWKSMNTLKDVIELNELYDKGVKPWLK